jgi:uncharacterized protein involved in exopolysaccharide biosynthesis
MSSAAEHSEGDPVRRLERTTTFLDVLIVLAERWRLLLLAPLLAGALAAAATYVIRPTFTGRTSFLPPQSQQSIGSAALASFGALSGLAPGGLRTPTDQFAALLQSDTVRNRLIDRFDLVAAYDVKLRHDARRVLAENTRISVGRRDGLITVEVDDHDAARSAALANAYFDELRTLASSLALTEAQQRRAFFEAEVKATRERLARAQQELQRSGFSALALRAEPRAAAENYARLQAQVTAADVRLQSLRRNLTDSAPEVMQQASLVSALRRELAQVERDSGGSGAADEQYVARYREFRYQETLLELLLRQFELARLDESRDGASMQVVDVAAPPERRTSPKRGLVTLSTVLLTALVVALLCVVQASMRALTSDDDSRDKIAKVRQALRLRQ